MHNTNNGLSSSINLQSYTNNQTDVCNIYIYTYIYYHQRVQYRNNAIIGLPKNSATTSHKRNTLIGIII